MKRESLERIDFYRVIDEIAKNSHSNATRELVEGISPLENLDSIIKRYGQIGEIKRLRDQGSPLSLYPFEDISGIINRIRPEGVAVEPRDLLILLPVLRLIEEVLGSFHKKDLCYLKPFLDGLSGFPSIRSVIERTVDDQGNILDSASPILRDIRNKKRVIERRIKKRLEELIADRLMAPFLRDSFISTRSGRWVIPVRMDSKGEVKGIVHDISRSGDTAFIEPIEIIGLSNELENTIAEEKVEELRILRDICGLIRANADEILRQFRVLLEIDLLNSIVIFSERLRAQIPHINESSLIRLYNARHPVLLITKSEDECIPLNIELNESERVVVITGPNAGGKTVAVKTLGLLTAMALSGIPIPADSSSTIPMIRNIYVDIGDEQSIIDNLSTFSGHIMRISYIIEKVGARDMVIIDELGTGTDPSQGASLGCVILEELRDRGAIVFATTHLIDIVGFVYTSEGMINASMEFDQVTLSPLYRLRIGEPGESHAFEIAAKYGLSEDIIKRAKARIENETDLYRLINGLKEKMDHYEGLIREEESRLEMLKAQEERLQGMLLMAEKEREKRLRKAYEEAREMVINIKRRLNSLIEEAKVKGAHGIAKEMTKIHREVEKRIRSLSNEPLVEIDNIREGDLVFVRSAGEDLKVLRVYPYRGTLRVKVRNMEVEVPIEDISPPKGSKVVSEEGVSINIDERIERELNIIGSRIDEGIQRLESFLNHAFLSGIREVRIIHGTGKGLLLRAVREHLKGHGLIEGFGPADRNQGGEGVTVVKLVSRF